MKISKLAPCLVMAITALSTLVATATPPPVRNFTGSFAGFYAPINWTIVNTGNPGSVDTVAAPDNVTITGAFGPGTVPSAPSTIDYSVVTPTGPAISVSFTYTFFNPIGLPGDKAELLDNNVVLASLIGGNQQFYLDGTIPGGDTLTFRVYSVNVNLRDSLQLTPIPEPSTLALVGLGGAACLVQLRRKSVRR